MSKVCQPRRAPLCSRTTLRRAMPRSSALRQAGMILLGKTNTVQFAYGGGY